MKNINILNNLNSGKTSSYFTTNGTKEFNCDNAGYVDNVVIEGQTLVNLMPFVVKEINNGGDYFVIFPDNQQGLSYNRVSNGIYTLFNLSQKNVAFEVADIGGYSNYSIHHVDANSCKVVSISNTQRLYSCVGSVAQFETLDKFIQDCRVAILEGDHTDKPISYFEGLKSVGQGDKIEVVSCGEDVQVLKNFTKGLIQDSSGNYLPNTDFDKFLSCLDYVPVLSSCEYFIDFDINKVYFYDSAKKYISYTTLNTERQTIVGNNTFKTPDNCAFIRFRYNLENNTRYPKFATLCKKQDKKQISTTLRSLPNGVKDTIEKRGNKYVKVQRCGEVTLNGSENWNWVASFNNVIRYSYFIGGVAYKPSEINCNSDKFKAEKNELWNNNSEQIDVGNGDISINVMKNKLSNTSYTDSLNIKTWLQANPITVVYELATPQITELSNFNPQTYEGDTTLLLNSGVIQCDASFTVNEGIRSELDEVKDKVSNLTESVKNSLGSEMSNEINTIKNTVNNNTNEINTIKNTVNTVQKTKMTEDNGACRGIPNNNANDIDITGFWMGANVSNAPTGTYGWVYIESKVHNSLFQVQIATDLHNSERRWIRHKVDGGWSEWRSL